MISPLVTSSAREKPKHLDRLVAVTACYLVVAPSLVLLVKILVPPLRETSFPAAGAVVYGCFALALVTSLRAVLAHITPWTVGIACALSLAFGLMIAFDQSHADYYLVVAVDSLVLAVPWLFVANAVENHGRLLRYLHGAAIAVVVAFAFQVVLQGQSVGARGEYSQHDGYQLLPAGVIFVDAFARRPRMRTALLAGAALLLLLASGARGPLLALVLFGVVRGALALRHRPRAALLLLAAGLIVTQAFGTVLRALSGPLSAAFSSRGLSTRSLDRLVEGEFLQDRARSALAQNSWDLILQHPLTGVGVARDRLLLADSMGVSDPAEVPGWYPHNVVFELLLQYGLFIGSAAVLFLAVVLWRAVMNNTNAELARVVLVFVGIGLFPLFVSASYLTWPAFFALVGFCLSSRHQSKRIRDAGTSRPVVAAARR